MLHHRAGRRKEHTFAAVLPANQVGRCAIGAMYLDDHALAIHIADVTAFDQELITCNRAHLLPPSVSGAITLTVVSPGNQGPKVPRKRSQSSFPPAPHSPASSPTRRATRRLTPRPEPARPPASFRPTGVGRAVGHTQVVPVTCSRFAAPIKGPKVRCGSGAPAGNRPSGPGRPRLDVVGWR